MKPILQNTKNFDRRDPSGVFYRLYENLHKPMHEQVYLEATEVTRQTLNTNIKQPLRETILTIHVNIHRELNERER